MSSIEENEHIIDMGKDLKALDPKYKVDENLIRGCQSRVWLNASMEGENLTFQADSDAIITRGIIGMLIRVLSGEKPSEIINADLGFIKTIGLYEHLSPTRSNGLVSMIKQIKSYALVYEVKA